MAKVNSSRQRFGKVAKAANAVCHSTTNSVGAFKTCMRTEMRAGLKSVGFKVKGSRGKRR